MSKTNTSTTNPILLPCARCGDSVPIQRDDGQPVHCLACAAQSVRQGTRPQRTSTLPTPCRIGRFAFGMGFDVPITHLPVREVTPVLALGEMAPR